METPFCVFIPVLTGITMLWQIECCIIYALERIDVR